MNKPLRDNAIAKGLIFFDVDGITEQKIFTNPHPSQCDHNWRPYECVKCGATCQRGADSTITVYDA